MKHSPFTIEQSSDISALFRRTFTQSEGEDEGNTIATLVDNLVKTTDRNDLYGYCAIDQTTIAGCIFFSRLLVASDDTVFMLSPVAVLPEYQSKGVGQGLIRYGLEQIKSGGAEFVVTYGDPAYYSKTGFEKIGQDIIQAPYPLAFADGWQALSLSSKSLSSLRNTSKSQCVDSFRNPAYW